MIPVSWIVTGVAGTIALTLGAGVAVQTKRLETCQQAYAQFVADTKRLGEEAEKKARETEAKDRQAKETADADLKALRGANVSLARSLRDERESARRSSLSRASAAATGTQRACLDRAELLAAVGRLDEGLSELAQQADADRDGLNSVRKWARQP